MSTEQSEPDEIVRLRNELDAKEAEIARLSDRVADLEQYIKKAIGDTTDAMDDLSHARISLRIALGVMPL